MRNDYYIPNRDRFIETLLLVMAALLLLGAMALDFLH